MSLVSKLESVGSGGIAQHFRDYERVATPQRYRSPERAAGSWSAMAKAQVLLYTILYYTILYYTILYYTILYYTIL